MTENIALHKAQLRQQCRAVRKSLGEEKRRQASQALCERIESWPLFLGSETILTYMPIKFEADLTPLLERHPTKDWVLPRILPEQDHDMLFHPYHPQRLVRHPFGMEEPAPDSPVVPARDIQLAFVPGLAFDRSGWRLGYGGGYYDRFLKHFKGVSAGIVFQSLLLESVPHTELDIPMGWIFSEQECIATNAATSPDKG